MEIEGILDLKDKFLPLQEPWEICGHVTEQAARQTGLAAGTPVASIGWDVVCCSAGVGAVDDGQANIILGTSGVIMLTMPKFAHSPMLGCQTIHNIPGKWQQLIAPLTGTPNSDWFVNNFTCADKLQAEKEGRSVYALFDEVIDLSTTILIDIADGLRFDFITASKDTATLQINPGRYLDATKIAAINIILITTGVDGSSGNGHVIFFLVFGTGSAVNTDLSS